MFDFIDSIVFGLIGIVMTFALPFLLFIGACFIFYSWRMGVFSSFKLINDARQQQKYDAQEAARKQQIADRLAAKSGKDVIVEDIRAAIAEMSADKTCSLIAAFKQCTRVKHIIPYGARPDTNFASEFRIFSPDSNKYLSKKETELFIKGICKHDFLLTEHDADFVYNILCDDPHLDVETELLATVDARQSR